jgi:hypothetical protein
MIRKGSRAAGAGILEHSHHSELENRTQGARATRGEGKQEGNGVDQSTGIRGSSAAGNPRMRGYATASGRFSENTDGVLPTTSNSRVFYFRGFIFINWALLSAII